MYVVGQDVRDRFSGGIEAFARRNNSGHHGEHSRHRSSDDVPPSKEVVSNSMCINCVRFNFVYVGFPSIWSWF